MTFEFMKKHSKEFSIEKMAYIFGVSRCGYYEFLNRGLSKRSLENQILLEEIKKIHENNRKVYGSPRIHVELKKQGKFCSRNSGCLGFH